MTTAGIDPNLANNIQLLQKQSLKVEFHLNHTDYKKVENIGTGAYGVVCSAINRKTRQRVAIKKIPNLFTMDPRYAVRTYREIKILQHFKHGNIIAIREILQPANKDITDIYVVMDLMESDLHRIIYSKQSLTDEHVQYFLYQILRGLKYIHSAHVIHRDLKPSNLLVNADCELKIGDFGMARGINFKAEKSNQQMTQYVATRWYRAPELIVAVRQGYGAAIDMWSVGCIFAEMLRRKHLFPGRDLLNQLAVIFGTLGIPSKKYLELLDSDNVCGFIRKVTDTDEFKPKTCAELCPKATPDAIDLLSKMLVIEPEKRIDVEKALTHPFLAKYHDNTFEPRSSKTFDFAFEQELVNLHNDDQKRVKIQDLLRKEVLSYRKPKPMDFGALITAKSTDAGQQSASAEDNPYADLNAFLAQLASPDKETSANASANPLLAVKTSQPANSLLDNQPTAGAPMTASQNPLLESQTKNPLLNSNQLLKHNSLLNEPAKVPAAQNNPLLTQGLPFQHAAANPLLAGASKPNPLLAGNNIFSTKAMSSDALTKTKLTNEEGTKVIPADNPQKFVLTTSESDQSNDTDLFNSFLKTRTAEKDDSEPLTVNTKSKSNSNDIEMISAKLEQTDISTDKQEEPESKALDTKSLLRQRLISKQNSNTGNLKGQQEKPPGKTPITAHQRQKEREERRKQKKLVAKNKNKKKKEADTGKQLLTTEDQRMLDRWRAMAKPQPIQPKPSGQTNTIVTTGANNVIVVYPSAAAHTYISSTVPVTSTSTNQQTILNGQLPGQQTNCQIIQPQIQSRQVVSQIPNAQIHSQQSASQILNPQIPSQPPSQIINQQMLSQQTTSQILNPLIQSQPPTRQVQVSHDMTRQVNAHSMFNNSASQSQRVSHPIRSFSDLAAMHGNSDQGLDHGQETSMYEFNQYEAEPMYSNTNNSQAAVTKTEPSAHRADHFAHWTNDMSVNTTLDITRLVEHKNDDGLPPMLVSTPKGTGGGYGVGYDMESMMAYNPDMQNVNMDSAPLSASLLADWMDVTSSMDPKALEDIQHELELSSALHDFPFNY